MAKKAAPRRRRPPPPKPSNHWERRMVIGGMVVCLWLTVLSSWSLTWFGREVPREIYYLGTASIGALAALLWPEGIEKLARKGK